MKGLVKRDAHSSRSGVVQQGFSNTNAARFLCERRHSFIRRNQSLSHYTQNASSNGFFHCVRCNSLVTDPPAGSEQRNHCPRCLWSMHVDFQNGDRRSACRAGMEPIAVWVKQKGEWSIIHRCTKCGALRLNRIAGDDNETILLSLALRPIAMPAFPLDHIGT